MGIAKIGPAGGEVRVKTNTNQSITMAIFFDGTGNNMYNTDERNEYNKIDDKYFWQRTDKEKQALNKNVYQANTGADSSYENSYSNVARLFKNYKDDKYPHHYKIYIEGIGTLKKHEDDIMDGTGLGRNEHGITGRVKDACKQVAKVLDGLNFKNGSRIVETLTVDVFGFSRGAATARHFIYEITSEYYKVVADKIPYSGIDKVRVNSISTQLDNYKSTDPSKDTSLKKIKHGYLGECCLSNDVQINRIVIRFAGLFETVASYSKDIIWSIITETDPKETPKQFTDDTNELHLAAIAKARRVIHLTAEDEHRANFPLTNIKSAGTRGTELVFPGVHSDVGGCYEDNKDEEVERLMQITIANGNGEEANQKLETEKKRLIQQGWYNYEELSTNIKYGGDLLALQHCLQGTRKMLRNTYSFIPLHIMCQFAVEFDKTNNPIPFDLDALTKSDSKTAISNDPLLVRIKERLKNYAFKNGAPIKLISTEQRKLVEATSIKQYDVDNTFVKTRPHIVPLSQDDEDLLWLRHKYLHWSAKYDRASARIIPNYPRIDKDGYIKRLVLPG